MGAWSWRKHIHRKREDNKQSLTMPAILCNAYDKENSLAKENIRRALVSKHMDWRSVVGKIKKKQPLEGVSRSKIG